MAEELTSYLSDHGIKVRYLHSDIDTVERMEIIRDLRLGEFDVLVGINLLREGLDMPEVSLVAILDADKEGFLRSSRSLIQTVGRAARNINGRAIFYADKITPSMQVTIDETKRRREIQEQYNKEHNIVPKQIQKKIVDVMEVAIKQSETFKVKDNKRAQKSKSDYIEERKNLSARELVREIDKLREEMIKFASDLKFEEAAKVRDVIQELEQTLLLMPS